MRLLPQFADGGQHGFQVARHFRPDVGHLGPQDRELAPGLGKAVLDPLFQGLEAIIQRR
jgi:hypothetical protein